MLKPFDQHVQLSVVDELNFALGMVEALTNNSTVAFVVCDMNHLVSYVNRTFVSSFGWTDQEVIGVTNPTVPAALWPAFIDRLESHDCTVPNGETFKQRKDGSMFSASESVVPLRNKAGRPIAYACIIRDITVRKQAERELKISKQWYKSLFEQNPDAVFSLDISGVVTSANLSVQRISGYLPHDLIGRRLKELINIDHVENARKLFYAAHRGESQHLETAVLHKNGSRLHLHVIMLPIKIDEEVVGVYCIAKDTTQQKEAEATIHYMAYHDTLTSLPNRRRFNEATDQAMIRASVDGSLLAVLVIDMDGFKQINDSYGHAVGDQVLQLLASRLKTISDDGCMAARMGGDEFTVLLTGLNSEEPARELAKKLVGSLCLTMAVGHLLLRVSPSIGIAMYPEHGTDEDTLLLHADTAMYQVKMQGKNGYRFYSGA